MVHFLTKPLPETPKRDPITIVSIISLLMLSASCLASAPLLMPASYSWIQHSTSESAAQGVIGAWLARLGFVTFGLAVLWLSYVARSIWARGTTWLLRIFAVCLLGTAAFSHKPWLNVPFDQFEDWLHSLTASVMGMAFIFGVFIRLIQRKLLHEWGWWFDALAVLIALIAPLLMVIQPTIGGFVQRLMFLTAYVWYGRETIALLRH